MRKLAFFAIVFILSLGIISQSSAQLLDEEEDVTTSSLSQYPDNDDALFDEIFGDIPDTEKDITKVKTFDDAIERLSQEIKKENSAEDIVPAQIPVTPLKGEMFVGIQKGSFKIFRDMGGRSKCSFNVVLKSELDKDIKVMALNLVYPKRVFAFVFKDVPSKQLQKRRITTAGDICYNMTNAPDINIHICKIKGTLASDCIKHIKWSDTLE